MTILALDALEGEDDAESGALLAACEAMDGSRIRGLQAHELNFHREMRSYFTAREDGSLVGLASLFSPMEKEAELSACVLPGWRRRGVFRRLRELAIEEVSRFGVERLLAVCDRASASGMAMIKAAALPLSHSEYAMRYEGDFRFPEPPRDFCLRRAREGDLEDMVELNMEAFGDSRSDARSMLAADQASPDREQYLALLDGKPVGIASLGVQDEEISINGLGIARAEQGKGLGSALLQALLSSLRMRDRVIVLDVDSSNERAHALYAKTGFEPLLVTDYFLDSLAR